MKEWPIFRESDQSNLELVRQIVLERLRNQPRWNQFDYTWANNLGEPYFVKFEKADLRKRFVVLANEVMWQFIVQGVIAVGLEDANNLTLPWFHVTDYGRQVLEAERFIPHDPTGYVAELRSVTGPIQTAVAIAYVEESLRCFNAGCHMASVLLLGIAAESIFNELCLVVQTSLASSTEKGKVDSRLPVKGRHRWIVQKYLNLPDAVRRGQLPESLDLTLTSLYELIRRQRNELGHPQPNPPDLTREQAFVFFRLFPSFLGDLQAFADYCQRNSL